MNRSRREAGTFWAADGTIPRIGTSSRPFSPPSIAIPATAYDWLVRSAARLIPRRADDPIEPIFRDYRKERPVPEATFRFFRRLFAYDRLPLDARIERRDSTAQWRREKVSYDAGYGGERLPAYLFLPRRGRPPYQAVVFFPGSLPLRVRSSERLVNQELFDFLVQNGRAVIYPVYKGTYERDDGTRFSDPDPSNRYKEHVIQWEREVSRTVDYLASRGDIDTTRIAYLGFSWGGRLGGVMLAIEQRFKAAVLVVAGLNFRSAQPEVDDINYLPHVRDSGAHAERAARQHLPAGDRGQADVRPARHAAGAEAQCGGRGGALRAAHGVPGRDAGLAGPVSRPGALVPSQVALDLPSKVHRTVFLSRRMNGQALTTAKASTTQQEPEQL